MSIFRAYDIRGVYPTELNEELAYKIGRAFVTFLGCKEVVVGRDMRVSSDKLFNSLVNGLTDQGANVIDIGLSSTPMLYFAAHDKQAAIMITASHNSGEYNGFKLCRKNSIPISGDTGIKDIESLVKENNFEDVSKGSVTKKEVLEDFVARNIGGERIEQFYKVVIDSGNGMGGHDLFVALSRLPIHVLGMNVELDGSFPVHVPNPMNEENVSDLKEEVVRVGADIGIAPDGDVDRIGFVDEKGQLVNGDMITALIAKSILKENPGSKIMYDLRSSRSVKEEIEQNGGIPIMCRVGHSFIKQQMRQEDAAFAGEITGHFYFKDNFFTENSTLALIYILNLMSEEGKTLSELIEPLKKYHQSGEINSNVDNKEEMMKELEEKYSDGFVSKLDGVSISYVDWWFNVRPSNTESVLRLNVEANT
ncbi:MAG: phosphomannomutase/phosphoglucomutase, partial [Candidatus Aenigmarchaeota archaeon]|nr:phosphomannomutase/phosphoglucomutase [Candidatus Aenigmarchaeota archaeon]